MSDELGVMRRFREIMEFYEKFATPEVADVTNGAARIIVVRHHHRHPFVGTTRR